MTKLQAATIAEFKAHFGGDVLLQDSTDYDEVRQIWNAMIDRRPALIPRARSPEDVVKAVKFARKHELVVSVRGGGHNIAGNAVCDGGLMIDLSLMRRVQVDPSARQAEVEPGCTLGDFDAAAQAHGLAMPLGINSTTGVAGLTLGGGFGWLSRKHGILAVGRSQEEARPDQLLPDEPEHQAAVTAQPRWRGLRRARHAQKLTARSSRLLPKEAEADQFRLLTIVETDIHRGCGSL